jgi:uncharacterized protein (TIGR03083 family)
VPTCPEWTVGDLVRHVANGYLNVVVRQLRLPVETPVRDLGGTPPLAALDSGYAEMLTEFTTRDPGDPAGRFWLRRMVHETAIHRVDAELAVTGAPTPIPEDLATDGVGEMLTEFLARETRTWTRDYAADLGDWGDRWVLVSAGDQGWRVTVRPEGVDVAPADTRRDVAATARISGAPGPLVCWLYNRGGTGDVVLDGDAALIAQLRRLLTALTTVG